MPGGEKSYFFAIAILRDPLGGSPALVEILQERATRALRPRCGIRLRRAAVTGVALAGASATRRSERDEDADEHEHEADDPDDGLTDHDTGHERRHAEDCRPEPR